MLGVINTSKQFFEHQTPLMHHIKTLDYCHKCFAFFFTKKYGTMNA